MEPTTARRKVNPVTDRRVMDLYREGWHLPNIASIARLKPDTVREVLERHNVFINKVER